MKKYRWGNRAQNIVEYVLLVTSVVVLLIIFLTPKSMYKTAVENSLLNGTRHLIEHARDEIKF